MMVQSQALTVKEYLAELPPDRREIVTAVRKVILGTSDKGLTLYRNKGRLSYPIGHSSKSLLEKRVVGIINARLLEINQWEDDEISYKYYGIPVASTNVNMKAILLYSHAFGGKGE